MASRNMKRRVRFVGNNPRYKCPKTSVLSGTTNRFKALEADDMDTSDDEEVEVPSPREKFPPIVVDESTSFTTIFRIMGSQYKFQKMSIGTKIISSSLVLYEEAVKKLTQVGFKFYTHQLKNHKMFKLVLFGLPKLEIKKIVDEFKESHNIVPASVKEISTKRSNIDDAIYMLEFDRQQVSKKEIRKIRYFYGIVVKWRNPIKSNKGPTQCTKCTMFGHGSRNCHRNDVCAACAGNHDLSVCTLSKTQHEGPVVYKCFNCTKKKLSNVNHKADDPKCPCRQDYLEMRSRITSGATLQKGPRNHYEYYVDPEDFPQFVRNSSGMSKTHARSAVDIAAGISKPHVRTGTNATAGASISYVRTADRPTAGASGIRSADNRKTLYSDITSQNNQFGESDDLSNDKLLDIYFEAIDALQQCRNKYDKLRVLGMMLRHAL